MIVLLVLTVLIVCLSIRWLYRLLKVYVVASRLIWRQIKRGFERLRPYAVSDYSAASIFVTPPVREFPTAKSCQRPDFDMIVSGTATTSE